MSHETADDTLLERLTRPTVPLDLLVVVGYVVVAAVVVFQSGVYGTPLAVALGVPLLLFAPGYALVSLLFPGATPDDARRMGTGDSSFGESVARAREHGISGTERLALGLGVSLALLPPLGIALAVSPWGIGPASVLGSVVAIALGCSVGAAIRRFNRPTDRRFSVPVRRWLTEARAGLRSGPTDTALNVGLAIAVVLAVAAIGYAVAAPGPGQRSTGISLLTQNETGEFVAEDYPSQFTRGESKPIVVELQNHEGRQTSYTVVVELQRVRKNADQSARVVQERQLARFTPTVEAGEEWRTRHDVTPTMTGENLRLTYLLYTGDPPKDPTTENADEHVHVWVNVSA
ncbi:DUF1616 domain-containing protein [Halorussus halophilus]|uniref:DUF1616 domain-containing protein n=1 Tax=Halorussus halophilus TaxID=2650975 RepID=UPI001300F28D|nr:DUF1616 domain-containing protein [Halorussus halophilus]